jgi:NTE family protein
MYPSARTAPSDHSPKYAAPDPGLTLCLSGGGFRATLFHLGALRRLNELGVLSRVKVLSSVSGGSILNGLLACRWTQLLPRGGPIFQNLDTVIGQPIRDFCGQDLRTALLVGARLNPANLGLLLRDYGAVPARLLADAYRDGLYRTRRLAEMPTGDSTPRFIFCATSVQTGACWQFHGGPGGRMGDFYTGYCEAGSVSVAEAVAASSAFPPGFGGLRLPLPGDQLLTRVDPWGVLQPPPVKRLELRDRAKRPAILTDGGVYDNLALEPVWSRSHTLLVSDAGKPFESVPSVSQALVPRLRRAAEIGAEQAGAVRKRWLIERLARSQQLGAAGPVTAITAARNPSTRWYGAVWTINTRLVDYPVLSVAGYGEEVRQRFAAIRTDLNAFTPAEIECLENHGYALADAAVQSYAPALCTTPPHPFVWPYPNAATDQAANAALKDSANRHLLRDVWGYCKWRWR